MLRLTANDAVLPADRCAKQALSIGLMLARHRPGGPPPPPRDPGERDSDGRGARHVSTRSHLQIWTPFGSGLGGLRITGRSPGTPRRTPSHCSGRDLSAPSALGGERALDVALLFCRRCWLVVAAGLSSLLACRRCCLSPAGRRCPPRGRTAPPGERPAANRAPARNTRTHTHIHTRSARTRSYTRAPHAAVHGRVPHSRRTSSPYQPRATPHATS
jgi:hypothetical protein